MFRLKEDADEVERAKKQIDEYSKRVEELTEKIAQLSDQSLKIKADINMLEDITNDLTNKSEYVVYRNPNDGPDDDK